VIVRGRLALRLAGRRRETVPTTLWQGLAHLVVTGSFHRHVEQEPLPAREIATRLTAAAAGWSVRASEYRGETVELWFHSEDGESSGVQESTDAGARVAGVPHVEPPCHAVLALHATVSARHPRGRPGVTLELMAVPGAAGQAGRTPADSRSPAGS
jgi:hypothetical protein